MKKVIVMNGRGKQMNDLISRQAAIEKESSLIGKDADMIMLDEFGMEGEKNDAENRKK